MFFCSETHSGYCAVHVVSTGGCLAASPVCFWTIRTIRIIRNVSGRRFGPLSSGFGTPAWKYRFIWSNANLYLKNKNINRAVLKKSDQTGIRNYTELYGTKMGSPDPNVFEFYPEVSGSVQKSTCWTETHSPVAPEGAGTASATFPYTRLLIRKIHLEDSTRKTLLNVFKWALILSGNRFERSPKSLWTPFFFISPKLHFWPYPEKFPECLRNN